MVKKKKKPSEEEVKKLTMKHFWRLKLREWWE